MTNIPFSTPGDSGLLSAPADTPATPTLEHHLTVRSQFPVTGEGWTPLTPGTCPHLAISVLTCPSQESAELAAQQLTLGLNDYAVITNLISTPDLAYLLPGDPRAVQTLRGHQREQGAATSHTVTVTLDHPGELQQGKKHLLGYVGGAALSEQDRQELRPLLGLLQQLQRQPVSPVPSMSLDLPE